MAKERELLKRAMEEIRSLRRQNERLLIRVEAIDDMLCLLHGKPGTKSTGEMHPDVLHEIDYFLAKSEKPNDQSN